MKQAYKSIKFGEAKRALIAICERILNEYIQAGYRITVRTLYYQLVSRDVIPNQEKSYKNLTGLVNDARMAGLLDWDVIEDRGRRPVVRPRWGDGSDFLKAVAPQYHTDHWDAQPERVFVVVEKDALAGVLEDTCHEFDVPLLAAKGYPSVSAVRDLVRHQIFPYMQKKSGVEGCGKTTTSVRPSCSCTWATTTQAVSTCRGTSKSACASSVRASLSSISGA